MQIEPQDLPIERLERSVDLAAPADRVWPQIGGFLSIVDWHPALASGEVLEIAGRPHRRVTTTYGAPILERLEAEGERMLQVAVVESLLPLEHHRATLRCDPRPGGCRVTWSAEFRSPSPRAGAIIANIHELGLAALAGRFGAMPASGTSPGASGYARAS